VATYELETMDAGETGPVVVALAGELDLTNASDLERRLGDLANAPRLVVDLNRVSFIDSAALQVLFRLARERRSDGLVFALDPSSPIATVVRIVDLESVVPIASSPDEATRLLT
jgi:anti-anti-sigma factor